MGNKIKLGLIGGGLSSFIGIVHRVAAYMGENYVLTGGVFDIDFDKGNQFAVQLELDAARSYPYIQAMKKSLPFPVTTRKRIQRPRGIHSAADVA